MSQLHVGLIKGRTGAGITFDANSRVTGVTTFNGSQQGINVISGVTTSSISGNITGTACTFTDGTFSGTLTYEDVTNVDSVGLITARKGMVVSGVSTFLGSQQGINVISGISTFASISGNLVATAATVGSAVTMNTDGIIANLVGSAATVGSAVTMSANGLAVSGSTGFGGQLREKVHISSVDLNSAGDIDLDNGMVHYTSGNLGGTGSTINLRSATGVTTDMAVGDAISVTVMTAVNASTAFINQLKIDHAATTENWVGGSAPTDGGGSGIDTYSFNILKTAASSFIVVASQTKTS